MFKIRSEKLGMYLVPVAFDHLLYRLSRRTEDDLDGGEGTVRFESEQNLETSYINYLCDEIEALDCPVCLDMRYISSVVDRGLKKFAGKDTKVFLCGVSQSAESLRRRIDQDLGDWVSYEQPEVIWPKVHRIEIIANSQDLVGEIQKIYRGKTAELLKIVAYQPLCKETNKPGVLLESSGVYVSDYVALKDLFLRMEDALFILFQMAEKISQRFPTPKEREGKTLICCSKTGAAYTSILSMMLGMPAVYCVSVGPKFALDIPRLRSEICEGRDYVYVFDFLCMGTEAKILYALVSSLGGNLTYGIGVANYLDIRSEDFRDSFFSKLETLTDITSAVPEYKIFPVIKKEVGG